MVKTCVAAGCNNTNKDGVSLHKFPKDPVLKKKWIEQVKRHRDKWEPTEYSVVCSQHFENSCFVPSSALMLSLGVGKKKSSLKLDAIPTIFFKPPSNGSKRACAHFENPAPKRTAYEKREQFRVSLISQQRSSA